MSGIQVSMLLQIMFQLMVAGKLIEDVTLPQIQNSLAAETNDAQVLPSGYVKFPEVGFAYKLSETELTHTEAKASCLKENGQFAVIDSREKVEKILQYFSTHRWAWVGLHRINGGNWTTTDGKTVSNVPWGGDGKKPRMGGNCAFISRYSDGIRNLSCITRIKFLCQIALKRN